MAGFLIGKVGVALAAMVFIGVAISMHSGLGRLAEREELKHVAGAIVGAIEVADTLPGEVQLRRELPAIAQDFEVMVRGERNGGLQVISVHVSAGAEVERVLMLSSEVNGGGFTLTVKNPREICIRKSGAIQLKLM